MKLRRLYAGTGFLIMAALLFSCDAGIVGNGDVKTETRTISDFKRLEIHGNFNVFLNQSGKHGLRIEADENLMDIIKVSEYGDKLEIRSEVNIIRARKNNIYIDFDEIKRLELTGALEISSNNRLEFSTLDIYGGGAINLNLDLEADWLNMDISGAGDFDFTGKAKEVDLRISGAGGFDLLDLETRKMDIEISGAAHARVYVTDELDVKISGAGAVRYKGNPETRSDISGIGSLKRY